MASKCRSYLFCCIFINIIEIGIQFSLAPKRVVQRNVSEKDANVVEKCYTGLGCVRLTPEWSHPRYRPINVLPSDRYAINTIFIQWTLKDGNLNSEIVKDFTELGKSLKILIHDFTSNGYTGWIQHLSRAFLLNVAESPNSHVTVVSVNWAAGAEPPFVQAAANARLVALEITHFLKGIKERYNCFANRVHAIGHGLGAHIAGYVGKMVRLAKITALDPTGPHFMNMPPHVRLHKHDASFVEVVHTDIMPYGQGYPDMLGHADFFPNGGKQQPGCEDLPLKITAIRRDFLQLGETLSACSHKRSLKYYIESLIHPMCTVLGVSCPTHKDFLRGKCTSCGAKMEYCLALATLPLNKNINNTFGFYFVTANSAPYCTEVLKVLLVLKSLLPDQTFVKGYFNITVPQSNIGDVNFLVNENNAIIALNTNDHHVFIVFRAVPPPLMMPCKAVHVTWIPARVLPSIRPSQVVVTGLMFYKISDDTVARVQWFCPISNNPPWMEPCKENYVEKGEITPSAIIIPDSTRKDEVYQTESKSPSIVIKFS